MSRSSDSTVKPRWKSAYTIAVFVTLLIAFAFGNYCSVTTSAIVFELILKQFVRLVEIIAWPALLLLVLFHSRHTIQHFAEVIAVRASDRGTAVQIGKDGMKITPVVEAQLESLALTQDGLEKLVLSLASQAKPADEGELKPQRDVELMAVANAYMRVDIKNWSERVARKNELAVQMTEIVVRNRIPRENLVDEHHEGLILALATVVHTFPRPHDLPLVFRACEHAERWHVQYRLVLAFDKLLDRGYVQLADTGRIEDILRRFYQHGDESLKKRIGIIRRKLIQFGWRER